jgi:hypothetical protein
VFLIATGCDDRKQAIDVTIAGFRAFISCLDNVEEAGVIHGTGVLNEGDIKGKPEMTTAYEMGKAI